MPIFDVKSTLDVAGGWIDCTLIDAEYFEFKRSVCKTERDGPVDGWSSTVLRKKKPKRETEKKNEREREVEIAVDILIQILAFILSIVLPIGLKQILPRGAPGTRGRGLHTKSDILKSMRRTSLVIPLSSARSVQYGKPMQHWLPVSPPKLPGIRFDYRGSNWSCIATDNLQTMPGQPRSICPFLYLPLSIPLYLSIPVHETIEQITIVYHAKEKCIMRGKRQQLSRNYLMLANEQSVVPPPPTRLVYAPIRVRT